MCCWEVTILHLHFAHQSPIFVLSNIIRECYQIYMSLLYFSPSKDFEKISKPPLAFHPLFSTMCMYIFDTQIPDGYMLLCMYLYWMYVQMHLDLHSFELEGETFEFSINNKDSKRKKNVYCYFRLAIYFGPHMQVSYHICDIHNCTI